MFNKPIFKLAFGSLLLTYVLNKIGNFYGLYTPVLEYDSLVHFFGGMAVSFGVLWFYFYSGIFAPLNRKYANFFLISLLGTAFIAFVWESFELIIGIMSVAMPQYFYDTTLDVTFGLLGALVACIYAYNEELKWKKKQQINLPSTSTEELVLPPEQISASHLEAEIS